jgi:hypothetical protein
MHIIYYETIYSLLDSLSKLYRESFSNSLTKKLEEVQDQRLSIISEIKTAKVVEKSEEKLKQEDQDKNNQDKIDQNENVVYTAHVTGNLKMKPNIIDEEDG